jgi:hypothetical protein
VTVASDRTTWTFADVSEQTARVGGEAGAAARLTGVAGELSRAPAASPAN